MTQILHITSLKMYQVVNTCHFCIFSCNGNHFIINIKALDIRFNIRIYHIVCFLYGILKHTFGNNVFPSAEGEITLHAGCNLCCHHSRFYGNGAAAAERVNQNTVLIPRSQHNHGCRQIFGNGRLCGKLAVASLVQGLSRTV